MLKLGLVKSIVSSVMESYVHISNTLTRTVALTQIGANEFYQKDFKKLRSLVAHLSIMSHDAPQGILTHMMQGSWFKWGIQNEKEVSMAHEFPTQTSGTADTCL